MIDVDALNVWFEQRLVGYLWRNDIDYIGFRYDSDWIQSNGFQISRMLPLQAAEFTEMDGIAHRFFANLLPEGGAREHVVRDLKITNTDFELLRAIGGECAGALSILPVEKEPSTDNHYHSLSREEFRNLVTRRGYIYASQSPEDRPRLSLAGAQDKCAIMYKQEQYFNPVGDAPSTHILKFESTEYRHLPLYEAFTSALAIAAGLPVVSIELCEISGKGYAQIQRYDRQSIGNRIISRIHQEDFCQALGYAHTRKYQHDGGPSFSDCLNLVRDMSSDPAEDIQQLLRWQIFNVLAGNSDGHAKNLSLIYHINGEVRLTPFYDLICTRAIERIDANLAFDIGGQRNPAVITAEHWSAFATQCDVGSRFLKALVTEMAELLLNQLADIRRDFETEYGKKPALQRIEKIVKQQCKRATQY